MEIKKYASGSKGNCYQIKDGKDNILIDCGIPFKDIMQKSGFDIPNVNGCLVSHSHKDHCKAVPDLLKHSVPCYMSTDTIAEMGIQHRLAIEIEPNKEFKICGYKIIPVELDHDVTNYGFFIQAGSGEKLAYLTDTAYVPYIFSDMDYLMIECNHSKELLDQSAYPHSQKIRIRNTHMSMEGLKRLLWINDTKKLKRIHLVHLSDRNSDEKLFKKEIQELTGVPVYT